MKSKSIGKNAILNMIRQGLSIVFPLIAYPYAVRTLGPSSLGKVNFVQSFIDYFSLLAMLGVSNYVIREGSRIRDNRSQFITFTNEVYTINVIFTCISYLILFSLTFCVPKLSDYKTLILLQSISLALTTFGIDWINTIYEDFFKITIRSICTYIITIILLFTFVKNENDYYIYSLLTVITNGIICITNRITCSKYLSLKLTKNINFKKHIIPLLILFVNMIAITINTNFDTTMIGWIKGDYDVGIYSLPVKIYTVIKNMIFAIYVVALPRLSYYVGKNELMNYKMLNSQIWAYLILFTLPISAGLEICAKYIILIMGGTALIRSVSVLRLLSLVLFFSILSGVIMNAMNISLKKEKDNLIVTIISALINIILNFLFIPIFSYNGAAFTTLISEIALFVLCIVRFPNLRDYLDIKLIVKELIHAFCGVISIVITTLIIVNLNFQDMKTFICIVICSVFSYIATLFLLRDSILISLFNNIKFKKSI